MLSWWRYTIFNFLDNNLQLLASWFIGLNTPSKLLKPRNREPYLIELLNAVGNPSKKVIFDSFQVFVLSKTKLFEFLYLFLHCIDPRLLPLKLTRLLLKPFSKEPKFFFLFCWKSTSLSALLCDVFYLLFDYLELWTHLGCDTLNELEDFVKLWVEWHILRGCLFNFNFFNDFLDMYFLFDSAALFDSLDLLLLFLCQAHCFCQKSFSL